MVSVIPIHFLHNRKFAWHCQEHSSACLFCRGLIFCYFLVATSRSACWACFNYWFTSGFLGPVPGLTGNQTASNQILFKWLMPYSLDGVLVLGYEIVAVVINSLNGDLISYYNESLTETNYSLMRMTFLICTHVNITVRAINSVGLGKQAYFNFWYIESKPLHGNILCFATFSTHVNACTQ